MTIVFSIVIVFVLHFIGILYAKYNDIQFSYYLTKYVHYTYSKFNTDMKFSVFQQIDRYDSFSHSVILSYGGINLSFRFGHNYSSDYDKLYLFGFVSQDCELLWADFCIYNPFKHQNSYFSCPWFPGFYLGERELNPNTGELIPINTHDYDYEHQYITTLTNVHYTGNDNQTHPVSEINFWITERRWTSILLHKLNLDSLYTFRRVDLEFEVSDKLGLGSQRDSWKGGVIASSVQLKDNLLDLFDQCVQCSKNKYYCNIDETIASFKSEISNRINYFLTEEHSY